MKINWTAPGSFCSVFLRVALAASFLSAVVYRFGFWGALDQPHVAWGNFAHFIAYPGTLASAQVATTASAGIAAAGRTSHESRLFHLL